MPEMLQPQFRRLPRTLLPCALMLACALAGCAKRDELLRTTGSLPAKSLAGKSAAIAPWQTQPPAPAIDAARSLSDREGDTVMASAIAEHEMRRP